MVKASDKAVTIPLAMQVKMISIAILMGAAIFAVLLGAWMSLMLWLDRSDKAELKYLISLETGRWFLLAGIIGLALSIPLHRSLEKKWNHHLGVGD